MKRLSIYWRTLRYLSIRQVFGQLYLRYYKRFHDPAKLLRGLDVSCIIPAVDLGSDWICPTARTPNGCDVAKGIWRFLGHSENCGPIPDWSRSDLPKLWLYNLHYHEFLWGMGFKQGKELVRDYMNSYGPERGRWGWEPYPISLRLMAWGTWFYGIHYRETCADKQFDSCLRLEMYRMGVWLSDHMEIHLGANHLLENALALAVLGAVLGKNQGSRFSRISYKWLRVELAEQIDSEGMHYERSPMYQQRLLVAVSTAFLASKCVGNDELVELLDGFIAPMAFCLAALSHPDGHITLFQDAAVGTYPKCFVICKWLQQREVLVRLPQPDSNIWLAGSSYAVGRNKMGDSLFVDFGKISPSFQPGHAHAAWGTFELSVSGKRFVVDAGNFDYEWSSERRWARSTAAHSTIQLENLDQAELWGAFRIGRRGQPYDIMYKETATGFELSGRHGAYQHLRRKPMIARKMNWDGNGRSLSICDWVEGGVGQSAVSRLWIDSDWSLRECGDYWLATLGERVVRIEVSHAYEIKGEVYPRFGEKKIARGLIAPIVSKQTLRWRLSW